MKKWLLSLNCIHPDSPYSQGQRLLSASSFQETLTVEAQIVHHVWSGSHVLRSTTEISWTRLIRRLMKRRIFILILASFMFRVFFRHCYTKVRKGFPSEPLPIILSRFFFPLFQTFLIFMFNDSFPHNFVMNLIRQMEI